MKAAKQFKLTKEQTVLFKLIRIGLNVEEDTIVPEDVDWKELFRLAEYNKVNFIVAAGLKRIGGSICEESIVKSFVEEISSAEISFEYYKTVIEALCSLFRSQGLKPVILKGIGLSEYYPIPSHRSAGDIDVYLLETNGESGAKRAHEFVENVLGIKVSYDNIDHQATFYFHNVFVEIHYFITDCFFGTQQEWSLISHLNNLLRTDLIDCGSYYKPSPTFNAVYLMRHIFFHFYGSGLKLRQFTDFEQLLRAQSQSIDWNIVERLYKETDLCKIHNAVFTLLEKRLGFNNDALPPFKNDYEIADRMLADCYAPLAKGKSFFSRLSFYYRNRWKIEFFTSRNWIMAILNSIFIHLANIKNNRNLATISYFKQV